jgi:hypothetical protein
MAIILTGGTAGLVAAGGNMLLAEGLAGGVAVAETVAATTAAASATAAAATTTVVTSTVAATGVGASTGSTILGIAGLATLGPVGWTLIGAGVLGEEINSLTDTNLIGALYSIDSIEI